MHSANKLTVFINLTVYFVAHGRMLLTDKLYRNAIFSPLSCMSLGVCVCVVCVHIHELFVWKPFATVRFGNGQ